MPAYIAQSAQMDNSGPPEHRRPAVWILHDVVGRRSASPARADDAGESKQGECAR